MGAVVYAIGMALTVFAKLPTLAELAFLIVAYVILGWDVVWQAVKISPEDRCLTSIS